jgi:Arc/MetJ-type ribon-helix-helix transcriptional regulator
MRVITVGLPETYIKALDELIEVKLYPNRAEAIRLAIKDLLKMHRKFEFASDMVFEGKKEGTLNPTL